MASINRVLVLSYYHPWIAGGGHRPNQLLIEDLKRGREVVFVCVSDTGLDSDQSYAMESSDKLSLYKLQDGILYPTKIYRNQNQNRQISFKDFALEFCPDYVRAHNPVSDYLEYIDLFCQKKIPFVYDVMDHWDSFKAQPWGDHITEQVYIDRSSMVFCITERLANSIKGKRTFVIPNAVSEDFFSRSYDMGGLFEEQYCSCLYEKNVVYIGAMWPQWFDWELCLYLVSNLPTYKFTFIGSTTPPKDEIFESDIAQYEKKLKEFQNVSVISEVSHGALKNWLDQSHVGIIPFKVDKLTLSCSPLKVFEYLSSGLPVVGTALSQLSQYPSFFGGSTYQEICHLLKAADRRTLVKREREEMREFIRLNTWEARMNEIDKLVGVLLQGGEVV